MTELAPENSAIALTPAQCQAARLARDSRFDGLFFTAVLSTGIFCRPTCPARAPREDNVRYYASAVACMSQGFRPCLRCRPDGAPGYRPAHALVARLLPRLDAGDTLASIAAGEGVTDRHLRAVFKSELGVSPKQYQTVRRCLLAKQLLHDTALPVTEVALACGFQSIRRFNDAFRQTLQLTPSEVRGRRGPDGVSEGLQLWLSYRPPYAWPAVQAFLHKRAVTGLEQVQPQAFARTLPLAAGGWFRAEHDPARSAFRVRFVLNDIRDLPLAVVQVRRILDLDANPQAIGAQLRQALPEVALTDGLRLPQFTQVFEAGVRAILGQQVSVTAARNMTETLVAALGEVMLVDGQRWLRFPTPAAVAASDLAFLKMPASRRQSLLSLARFCCANPDADPGQWLAIKGIGPWTVNYARMRGCQAPDVWLAGDLGIKHALARWPALAPDRATPWRSYLTLQLWELLS